MKMLKHKILDRNLDCNLKFKKTKKGSELGIKIALFFKYNLLNVYQIYLSYSGYPVLK